MLLKSGWNSAFRCAWCVCVCVYVCVGTTHTQIHKHTHTSVSRKSGGATARPIFMKIACQPSKREIAMEWFGERCRVLRNVAPRCIGSDQRKQSTWTTNARCITLLYTRGVNCRPHNGSRTEKTRSGGDTSILSTFFRGGLSYKSRKKGEYFASVPKSICAEMFAPSLPDVPR